MRNESGGGSTCDRAGVHAHELADMANTTLEKAHLWCHDRVLANELIVVGQARGLVESTSTSFRGTRWLILRAKGDCVLSAGARGGDHAGAGVLGAKRLDREWLAQGMSSEIANTSDPVVDAAHTDKPLTGADVTNVISQCEAMVAEYEATSSAVLNVVVKASGLPLE